MSNQIGLPLQKPISVPLRRARRGKQLLSTHAIILFGLVTSALGQEWTDLLKRLERDGHGSETVKVLFADPAIRFDSEPTSSKLRSLFEYKFRAGRTKRVQEGLAALGYDPGDVDGLNGPKTQRAIARFQRDHGYPRDARISGALVERIETQRYPDRVIEKDDGPSVYRSVLKPDRLSEARSFIDGHEELLGAIEKQYGLPREVAVAILTVETRAGNYLGSKLAFNTLASMSLCRELSCTEPLFEDHSMTATRLAWLRTQSRRTSNWAFSELKALLKYAQENGLDLLSMPGSIYGAIGVSQFMPTSVLKLGVDGDGDGVIDVFTVPDAVHSMANYLKKNGWRPGLSTSRTRRVIYRYNRSRTYVNTVLAVADRLEDESD